MPIKPHGFLLNNLHMHLSAGGSSAVLHSAQDLQELCSVGFQYYLLCLGRTYLRFSNAGIDMRELVVRHIDR